MEEKELFKNDKYRIIFDKAAGYYHLDPIPTKKELDEYYAKDFYSNNYAKQINDSSLKVQQDESDYNKMQYDDIMELIKKYSPGKKILDVGCGYGNFIKYCQDQGYQVRGVEPAADAVRYAKDNMLNVVQGEIENISTFFSEKFDVVVLLNVLEHLRNPLEVIRQISDKILVSGGVLIVKVPNEFNPLQKIANKEYDLKDWWVSIPQHINYFTIGHLRRLLEKNCFEILNQESTFPLELFILFGDQYVGDPELGKKIHQKRVQFEKTLKKYDNDLKREIYRKLSQIELGREVVIYAKNLNK